MFFHHLWEVDTTDDNHLGNLQIFQKFDHKHQNISIDKILWEAPKKEQQIYFIDKFGANVNLGNISGNEVISLETIRVGLRGDTFNQYL